MKEIRNSLTKSISKLKSSKSEIIMNNFMFKDSEIVANNILEKIISLVISQAFERMIQRNIPNFCIMQMMHKLDTILDIQYIKHDKDDLNQKIKVTKNKSEKLLLYKNNEQSDILLLTDEKKLNRKLNNSEIIPDYELIRDLNLYSSNVFGNKTVLNILNKKNVNIPKNNNDLSFSTSNKIQEIKDKKIVEPEIDNFWDTISQPKATKIDRGASTQIKIDTETYKNKKYRHIKNIIKEEDHNNEQLENTTNNNNLLQKRKTKKSIIRDIGTKGKKLRIKMSIPTDLPSFDIESDRLGINEENESIKNLRKEYEQELALKKEKEEKEKKLLKQKQLLELEEENNNKKKFMNSKVNTVKIRPIKIENLIAEFQDLKSHTKEIAKITDSNIESYYTKNRSKHIEIEVNENPSYQFSDERTDRKRKKIINQSNNNLINLNNINIKKIKPEKNISDRSGSKYASGSNFNLMKLECGVNLTENRKKKSGGKNFFEKYGKFSFELYKSKLNNTMSGNFLGKDFKEMMNDSMKKEEDNNQIKSNFKGFKKKKSILIKQKSDYDANIENIEIDNNTNNYLKMKTKNLKVVMNNLDLMKDFELNIDKTNNYMPKTKYNFFKNTINKNFQKNKKDLRDINDFNKTVLKNDFWGEPNNSNTKENFYTRQPFRFFHKKNINFPIIEFKRERLPPIYTSKLYNNSMIKNRSRINLEKEKTRNFSRDNINDDEKSRF